MALTNVEKQAAFRERRKQKEEEGKAEVRDLRAQLTQRTDERDELTRQLSALAKIIADLKGIK
jgi:hypothetical protein